MKTVMIILTPDEAEPDVLNVSVPSIHGCYTYGRSRAEAMLMAKEAAELCLDEPVVVWEST